MLEEEKDMKQFRDVSGSKWKPVDGDMRLGIYDKNEYFSAACVHGMHYQCERMACGCRCHFERRFRR